MLVKKILCKYTDFTYYVEWETKSIKRQKNAEFRLILALPEEFWSIEFESGTTVLNSNVILPKYRGVSYFCRKKIGIKMENTFHSNFMYTFVTRSSFCPLWLTVWSMFDIVPSYTTVKSDYKHNIKYINRERKRERKPFRLFFFLFFFFLTNK